MPPHWQASLILVGVAALSGLVALKITWGDQSRERWQTSVLAFRQQMIAFGAWFGDNLAWERAAKESRYPPKLSWGLVKDWEAGDGHNILTEDENAILKIAQLALYPATPDHSGMILPDFHTTRQAMTMIVGQWVAWDHQPGFRTFIEPTIRQRRNVLVMLAYLEIVLARKYGGDEYSEWSRIGDLWPEYLMAVAGEKVTC